MQVKQLAVLMNEVQKEILGEVDIITEDLSGLVDFGTAVFNANAMDNYVKSLVNHIGKVVFVDRAYKGSYPSVMKESWEFGSVLEKISMKMPEAQENESWELQDGASYDQNIFYKPTIEAKFFNNKVTLEVPISITERQVKESFSNVSQLNSFISMIYNGVEKSMTVKTDAVISRLINNMIAETLEAEYAGGTGYNSKSGIRAVNVLYLYNQKFGKSLTADNCLEDTDFQKFFGYELGLYADRLSKISTLFNIGRKDRFTPKDALSVVLLSEAAKASDVYLQSDTFHNEFTSLVNHETVPYWQASGDSYDFADTSAINAKTSLGNTVNATGIIGIMFDKEAVMACNEDRRTTTHYNAKAEFYSNWYKWDISLFADTNENFVVFFVA